MKKIFYLLMFIILIIPFQVNASLKHITTCDDPLKDEQIKTCYISVELTGNTKLYDVKGSLEFINTSLKGNVEAVDSRVRLINNDPSNLSFVTTTPIANETIKIAKFTVYLGQEGCKVTWKPNTPGINYVCKINNGYYYDKNGNLVTKEEYDKQCNSHTCQIIDGIYYDKNGSSVTSQEYDKQCNSHYCEIIDESFFGKAGTLITKADWENECTTPSPVTGASPVAYTVLISSLLLLITSQILIKKINKVHKI